MGGSTSSTQQASATPLQQLFAGSQGYQQPNAPQFNMPQGAAMQAPALPLQAPTPPLNAALSPAQAAQRTVAGMLARTPPPVAAPVAPPGPAKFTGDANLKLSPTHMQDWRKNNPGGYR